MEATRRSPTLAQMWQKLKSIESFANKQSQQKNGINNKLIVLKVQQVTTVTHPKTKTLAAMATDAKSRLPLYNKNNEIVVQLSDSASLEMIKKQAPEEVVHMIDAYLIENNISTIKLRTARTLLSGDIAIQTTNEEGAEKLRREDGETRVLRSKAKLALKRYGIVALRIPIAKIDLEKVEETKDKIITQNAGMCTGMKIESIFWLSSLKKDKRTLSLVIEVDDPKIANTLIEEELVLDHTLHGCMGYNSSCRIKQCFNYYKYGHVSVNYQKSTKCGALSGLHRTSEFPRDKRQKCPLCNTAHKLCDKRCEYKKKEYFRREAAKQKTPRLHEVGSKATLLKRKNPGDMRPPRS